MDTRQKPFPPNMLAYHSSLQSDIGIDIAYCIVCCTLRPKGYFTSHRAHQLPNPFLQPITVVQYTPKLTSNCELWSVHLSRNHSQVPEAVVGKHFAVKAPKLIKIKVLASGFGGVGFRVQGLGLLKAN